VIAPTLILILAITFAVLGVFKYNSKTMDAVQLYGAKLDLKDLGENFRSRQSKFASKLTFVERILQGEKDILRQIELINTKRDRRKSMKLANIQMGSFGSDGDFLNSF